MDDEDAVQKLLTYPLRKEGYEVVPALDGREALDRLSEDNFDLVVLDVMMPKMDGFDVCREIRARSTVPIIMLTAKTEEIDKVLARKLGADDYITKPSRCASSAAESRRPCDAPPSRRPRSSSRSRSNRELRATTSRSGSSRRRACRASDPCRVRDLGAEVGAVFSRTMLLERVWGDAYCDSAHHRRSHPSSARGRKSEPAIPGADPHRARGRRQDG